MTGSAMRKPRIHPGRGSASADSMIEGRTIVTGRSPRCCEERALAERLRVRVRVGPAQRCRPGSARLDHAGPAPTRARSCSVLAASAGVPAAPSSWRASLRKRARCSGVRLTASASRRAGARAVDLRPPVDVDVEGAVVHRLLGRCAAPVAGDVARRHRHEVRRAPRSRERGGDAARAEQVDLDRAVERRVERDARRRVDDDVARGERGRDRHRRGARPSAPRRRAITCTRARDQLVEPVLAELGAQTVEGVVAEDLPPRTLGDRRPPPGPDEQHQLAAGHGAQEPLDQGGAEEPGPARSRRCACRPGDRRSRTISTTFSTIW